VKRLVIAGGLILAVVVAFGVYRFYHAPRIKASQPCWNTLAQIDSAKQQWALESGATSGAPVTVENILPYLQSAPTCHVAGATYIIGKVGEEPRCTFHGTISHFNPDRYWIMIPSMRGEQVTAANAGWTPQFRFRGSCHL
jgi:hypothetical protein